VTLSIAACFPWGKLRLVNESLPSNMRMEQGIIVATDSRFTIGPSLSGEYVPVDVGRKLYPLDSITACAFAGEIQPAQEAVRWLRRYRGRRRLRPAGRVGGPIEAARFFLRQAYERFVPANEVDRRPLHALIATMTRDGQPVLLRFRSPAFHHLFVTGVTAVGWDQDIKVFERQLYGAQEQRWKEGNIQMTVDDWHMEAVVAMKAALANSKRTSTIGGAIQSVIITARQGVFSRTVNWVIRGGDPMHADDWEDLTVPLNRVRGWPVSAAAVAPESGLVMRQVMR
jgi:20S proteasome alpha/beta subunit